MTILSGLDCALRDPPAVLRDARIGLLMNAASVDDQGRYGCDLLAHRFPGQLTALFCPQHGLWGEQQANMVESPHGWYPPLDLPVYSLYSETRRPTDSMLANLDVLVVDLQDVGTRVYTFAWTLLECLRACAVRNLPVVVLDRPNPLGGLVAEGPRLDPEQRSFVGGAAIPLRHGLTLGELARWLNESLGVNARLEIVPLAGWRRAMLFDQTGRRWIATSPNMPRWETTLLYPGQVLLEGTNVSEGRGTTLPFEQCGAPWIDPFDLRRRLDDWPTPGVTIRAVRFLPTFDKYRGSSCGGIAFQIDDPRAVRSVALTVGLLSVIRGMSPDRFEWLPPPYEYEHHQLPIDILFGSPRLRHALARGIPLAPRAVADLVALDEVAWWRDVGPWLLYE